MLFYLKGKEAKIGFTASKKVGNAVFRNRAKRRLRALIQEFIPLINSGTYVFVAKEEIKNTSYETLQNDMKKALKKVSAFKDKN